jgi:hypothetical protein
MSVKDDPQQFIGCLLRPQRRVLNRAQIRGFLQGLSVTGTDHPCQASYGSVLQGMAPFCHSEHIRFAQGKLREGLSLSMGLEMLRCARHDNPDVAHARRLPCAEMLRCSIRCAQDKAQHDWVHQYDRVPLSLWPRFVTIKRRVSHYFSALASPSEGTEGLAFH